MKLFVDKQFDATKDLDIAVKRVALVTLSSPQFLYREIGAADGYTSRFAVIVWLVGFTSDQELLNAAWLRGQLATKEQVARQAERMLGDVRAKNKLRGFLMTWLKADEGRDIAKDSAKFPGFDSAVIDDLCARRSNCF